MSSDSLIDRRSQVLDRLDQVQDPDLHRSVVACNFIKNLVIGEDTGSVAFDVELTTPACPVKESLEAQCRSAVASLDWVRSLTVNMTAQKVASRASRAPGLRHVAHLIAVASCKGGVGKSTVAVSLALALARKGAVVGVFDADIHGPSLPLLLPVADTNVQQVKASDPLNDSGIDMILPFLSDQREDEEAHAPLSLMSFGWIKPEGAATMRGAMVSRVINQLLTTTRWGALDYLVIDLPPGTGDVQLTLAQIVPLSCAIMVSTPHPLSVVDVARGVDMFNRLQIPTVALVENMAYFTCDECTAQHSPFGQAGACAALIAQHSIAEHTLLPLVKLPPLDTVQGDEEERGRQWTRKHFATVVERTRSAVDQLASVVVREVSKGRFGADARPRVMYDASHGTKQVLMILPDGETLSIGSAELRRECRCADCVVEGTQTKKLDPSQVSDRVFPDEIYPMGNYGVGMHWSDGHATSIFPFALLEDLARAHMPKPPTCATGDPSLDW